MKLDPLPLTIHKTSKRFTDLTQKWTDPMGVRDENEETGERGMGSHVEASPFHSDHCFSHHHWPPRLTYLLVQITRQVAIGQGKNACNRCSGGLQKVFEHDSVELNCKMKFAIYLPPKAETGKCPALYWLSSLTCTGQNFMWKIIKLLQNVSLSSPFQTPAHVAVILREARAGTLALVLGLRGCHWRALENYLQNALLRNWGASSTHKCQLSSGPPKDVYLGPFHKRPQSSDVCWKNPGKYKSASAALQCATRRSVLQAKKKPLVNIWDQIQSKGKASDATHLVVLSGFSAWHTNWSGKRRPVPFRRTVTT